MHYPLTYNLWTTDSAKELSWSKSDVVVSGWDTSKRSTASSGVFGRLGLRSGDAVKVIGRPDQRIVGRLPEAIDRGECLFGEKPDVYLVWAADAVELRQELADVASQMSESAVVWAISAHPGKIGAAGEAIRQIDLLEAGHQAGLVDNRVAYLSDCEYGYRFAKPRTVLN